MTKAQIAKAAKKMVQQILWDNPAITFWELDQRSNAAYGTDEGKVIDAAIALLQARRDEARKNAEKLEADVAAIEGTGPDSLYLLDTCVAVENMRTEILGDSVDYWNEYYRCICNATACHAEEIGMDINARLGYSIY